MRTSPDEGALAYSTVDADGGGLFVIDGRGQRRVSPEGVGVESFDWDRGVDCGWIVAVRDSIELGSHLERWSCDGDRASLDGALPGQTATDGLAVIDDHRIVASVFDAGPFDVAERLVEIDVATGAMTDLTSDPDAADGAPSASRDGRFVVFERGIVGRQADKIGRLDLDAGTVTWLTNDDRVSSAPALSADGTLVVFDSFTLGQNDRATWVMSTAGGTPTQVSEAGLSHAVIVGDSVVLIDDDGVGEALETVDLPSG